MTVLQLSHFSHYWNKAFLLTNLLSCLFYIGNVNVNCKEQTFQTMLNRRAFSDVLPDPPRGSRRKEEARQVEFVRIGQALKLDTIVRGDAPTSLATTGLFKRAPWEPQCFYPDFGHEIVCGDSWGETRLLVATESGVFLVEGECITWGNVYEVLPLKGLKMCGPFIL